MIFNKLLPRSLKGLLLFNETVFLLLVVATGVLGGVWAHFWQQSSEEGLRINALSHDAEQIRGDMYRQLKEVNRARLTEDQSALTVYASYATRIEKLFDNLTTRATDDSEQLAITFMQQSFEVVRADMDKVFTNPFEVGEAVRMKLLDPAYEEELLGEFESAVRIFNEIMAVRRERLEENVSRWRSLAWLIIPIPILMGGTLLFASHRVLNTGFVGPMRKLGAGAKRLSEGALDHRIDAEGVREVSRLASSFNDMASQLSASRDALVAAERQAALGALVPVVAHNIRNPLASIRATAQLIDAHDSAAEHAQTKSNIIESVDRLERWVSALLSYLHPLKPHCTHVSLDSVLDGASAPLLAKLKEKDIVLEKNGWNGAVYVDVDRDLLEQALYGLLNNAADAAPVASTLTVALCQNDDHARITIDDEGQGIAFEPKPSDLSPMPSTKRMGTGLGIPFAYKVCEAHGAQITIRARDEGGTRVEILLPLPNARNV